MIDNLFYTKNIFIDFQSFPVYARGMHIGQVISKRRKELGWTQEDLAKKMGYKTTSSINKIELGINDIPQKKIKEFAKILDVDIPDFFPDVLTSYNSKNGVLTIPFISQKISADFGEELLPKECFIRKIDVLSQIAKGVDKATLVCAEVKGDSMIDANIFPNDYVIFSRGLIDQEGIYVISLLGEVMVKRLSFDAIEKKLTIISANKNYPPRTVSSENVRILGKVLGWIHNELG